MKLSTFLRRSRARRAMAGVLRRRRGGRRRYGKGAIKGFTAQQTNSIRRLINKKEETKYYAKQLAQNLNLDAAIHTPGTDILPLCPAITQGTDSFQRVGSKITPTKCRVDVNLAFVDVEPGNSLPPGLHNASQIWVVMYIVKSKLYKNWDEFSTTEEYRCLLDTGQGDTTPFGYIVNPTSTTPPPFWTTHSGYLQLPVDSTHFVLVKKRIVKLTRNTGGMFDANGWTANLPQSSWSGSFSYKLPKLQYDDTKVASKTLDYPTNVNEMIMFGYAICNNLSDETATGGDPPEAQPLVPDRLSITVRNHVWYKDA